MAIGVAAYISSLSGVLLAAEDVHSDAPLTLETGLGLASAPDYSGSATSSARARIWLDFSFRSEHFGAVSLDSGSLTLAPALRRPIVDDDRFGLTMLFGYRWGRNNQTPHLGSASDGSSRLHGLPNVPGTEDAGLEGHVAVFGVPLFAQLRVALHQAQGSTVNLGAYLPLKLGSDVELTLLPTVTWNDGRQAQAFYGVEPASAVTSGYAEFKPGATWQNAALETALDWGLWNHWHLLGSAAYVRLLGNAARSPLVQRTGQGSAFVGLAWKY